jgi:hypothetical protein
MPEHAAFFHFRHWDDFIGKSISATWNLPASGQSNANAEDIGCMVSAPSGDRVVRTWNGVDLRTICFRAGALFEERRGNGV